MHSYLISLDHQLVGWLTSWRTPWLTDIFLKLTALGSWEVVGAVTLAVSFALWLASNRRLVMPFILAVLGAEITAYLIKVAIERARPGESIAYYLETTFAFPSAHATAAVVLYGYLAYLLIRRYRSRKTQIVIAALVIMFLVGLSRVYLGVHYLSDVIGGYMVGALWLVLGTYLSRRV